MNIFQYLKETGLKRMIQVLYQYKIQLILNKILFLLMRKKPLQNIIIIESHNDFDCNGGAFYRYLIENNYNKNYKIVWVLKNKCIEQLPSNVICFYLYKPSIKKAYYIVRAKYLIADCVITDKYRSDQKSVYCFHGAVCLKNVRYSVPDSVDYILSTGEIYEKYLAQRIGERYPSDRFIHIGYPLQDIFFENSNTELEKLTKNKYKKVIVWMPTFRKGGGYKRNDSTVDLPLGVPIITHLDMYKKLNELLSENNVLLVIKVHPMQDVDTIKISDESNIKVLDAKKVKELNIDNYRLLKNADALISDYSSILYDYLVLNRPVGYVFSDLKEYKCGLCVDDLEPYIVGPIINTYDELCLFIKNIIKGKDIYNSRRSELALDLYGHVDGNACKKLADFIGLTGGR